MNAVHHAARSKGRALLRAVPAIALSAVLVLALGCRKSTGTTGAHNANDMEKETAYAYTGEPLRVAVIGLVHTHVHWILGREDFGDIEIVGIVEPNRELAERYSEQHGYSMDIVYSNMHALYKAVRPEAVLAFNTIYDHLKVVEFFAPKGVHIMVEKPLAVNLDHAQRMAYLAREHGVELLTNYETSWYGSSAEARSLFREPLPLGPLRRMVFNTGHPGPIEIGCNEEFLEWLTDPELNGGGALTDFGCYGANLATWFFDGEAPETVSCTTQQLKPHLYPDVDDDATIVLGFDDAQVIIQASWNWSHNRKDMEVYGTSGYALSHDGERMEILEDESKGAYDHLAKPLAPGVHDPFAYLAAVVRGTYEPETYEPSTLENNLRVMQILEAAKISARSGKTVQWAEFYPQPQKQAL